MEKLKNTLKAGLFNGLICEVNDLNNCNINIDIKFSSEDKENWNCMKPHLFDLSDLVTPIRMEGFNDGREFVPSTWIYENCSVGHEDVADDLINDPSWLNSIPKYIHDYLVKMKFNTEGLPPEKFINAKESKVYEPKTK